MTLSIAGPPHDGTRWAWLRSLVHALTTRCLQIHALKEKLNKHCGTSVDMMELQLKSDGALVSHGDVQHAPVVAGSL